MSFILLACRMFLLPSFFPAPTDEKFGRFVELRNAGDVRQRNQNPSATDVFNRVVSMNAFDECDAVINYRTRIFNDGITARKRIGCPECNQGKFLREQLGLFHKCMEVEAEFTDLQEFSNYLPPASDGMLHNANLGMLLKLWTSFLRKVSQDTFSWFKGRFPAQREQIQTPIIMKTKIFGGFYILALCLVSSVS